MSTTYFNNKKSNIEKLTKKVTKKKDTDDKNADAEDAIDKKIVEGFDTNPMSNIFGSSSNDNDDKDKEDDKTTNPTSATGTQDSNTTKNATSQLSPSSILVFCFHALLSVLFVYVWGALATNAIFLISESENGLDYILPIEEYEMPYTKYSNPDPNSRCWYTYGFPYNLGKGRVMGDKQPLQDKEDIEKRQKDITYHIWLSKEDREKGTDKQGVFDAFVQYLFEAVFGGLGINGGRGLIRVLLSGLRFLNKDGTNDETTTWKDKMENRTMLKVGAFIMWPLLMTQMLVPLVAVWSGIATLLFGVLQTHIIWGLVFSFTIGMFIAMANGFYMAIQTIYIFFIYPWGNNNGLRSGEWKDIFNNLKTYMLLAFYFMICFYGYGDLGAPGGAGIMLIVIVSIALQYWKNSG